jgi:hypothetical protein
MNQNQNQKEYGKERTNEQYNLYAYGKEYVPENKCREQDHGHRGELNGIVAAVAMMVGVGSGFSSWCRKVVAS